MRRWYLIQTLIVRAAIFSGFFACNFPNEKPTPKLYLALTHGIQFTMHYIFMGMLMRNLWNPNTLTTTVSVYGQSIV